MRSDVQKKLLALNREFYQTFAESFANSRSRPQPGIGPLLSRVRPGQPVLDLGCGHGTLAQALWQQDHQAQYIGLDNSPKLLERARQHCSHPNAEFVLADLAEMDWPNSLAGGPFPWVFALAVLHHLPGADRRTRWAATLRSLLAADGTAVVSVWNFPTEKKWRQRVLPWSTIGLSEAQVDAGDALLDWRRGGRGLRYVHHFDTDELTQLARAAGCRAVEQIEAGGSSGRLNRIQLWQPTSGPA